MVNNQTPCVIVKVITDYHYIYNIIGYDYIVSGNGDYSYSDHVIDYNRLRLPITQTMLLSNILVK